ncbi:MAG: hypothetical protein SGI92_04710 [Bryobacteraceae bacterium]|nr:hypothetical protein [Bryobacteraceae bacterium]
MAYLWRSNRKTQQPLDPALDVRSYQAALIQRYDAQIRLLSNVKYWYVLPLFGWMALVGLTVPSKLPGGPVGYFAVLAVLAGVRHLAKRKLGRSQTKSQPSKSRAPYHITVTTFRL